MGAANERERPKQIAYQRDFLGTCWNSPRKDESAQYIHSRWLGVSKQTMQLGTKHHCFIVRTYYVDEVENRINARATAAAKAMNEMNNFSFATRQAFNAFDGNNNTNNNNYTNKNEYAANWNNNVNNMTNGWENAGSIALGLHGPGSPTNHNNYNINNNNNTIACSSFASIPHQELRFYNNNNNNMNNGSPTFRMHERTLLHNKNGVWTNELVADNNIVNNNQNNNYPYAHENDSFGREPTFNTCTPSVGSNAVDNISYANSLGSAPFSHEHEHEPQHHYHMGKPQRRKSNDNLQRGKENIRRQARHTALQERVAHNFHAYLAMNGLSVHHSVIFRAAPSRRHYGRISLMLDGAEADATLASYLTFSYSSSSSSESESSPSPSTSLQSSEKESKHALEASPPAVVIDVPELDVHEHSKITQSEKLIVNNENNNNIQGDNKEKSNKLPVVVEVLSTTTDFTRSIHSSDKMNSVNTEMSKKKNENNMHAIKPSINVSQGAEPPLLLNDALSLSSVKESSNHQIISSQENSSTYNNSSTNCTKVTKEQNDAEVDNKHISIDENSYEVKNKGKSYSNNNDISNTSSTPPTPPAPPDLRTLLLELIGGSNFTMNDKDDISINATTPPVIVGTISPLELMSLPLNAEICFGGWLYVSLEDEQRRIIHAYEIFLENNDAPTVSKKNSPVTKGNKKENNKHNFLANAETSPLTVQSEKKKESVLQHNKIKINNKYVEVNERSDGVLSATTITTPSTTSPNVFGPNQISNNNVTNTVNVPNSATIDNTKTKHDDLEVMLTENVNKEKRTSTMEHNSYNKHKHKHKHKHHHHKKHSREREEGNELSENCKPLLSSSEELLQHQHKFSKPKRDEPVWMPNGYIVIALPMYECSLLPSTFHLESLGSKPISLNLANAQSRKAYGVGCITGVRYGGLVIIECWDRMTSRDVPWIAKLTSIRNALYRVPFSKTINTFNTNYNNNCDNMKREESMTSNILTNTNVHSKSPSKFSTSPSRQRNVNTNNNNNNTTTNLQLRSAPLAHCVQQMKRYILHELANHGLRVIEAYTLTQRKNGNNPVSLSLQSGELVYSRATRPLLFNNLYECNGDKPNSVNNTKEYNELFEMQQHSCETQEEMWNDSIVSMSEDKPENAEVRGVFRQIGGVKCMDANKLRYGAEACYVGKSIHTWIRGLLQWPIKARPLCIYLQRYEGIAHALLQRSMQSSIMDANPNANNANKGTINGNSFSFNVGSFHSSANFSQGSPRTCKPYSPTRDIELEWNTMRPVQNNGIVANLPRLKTNTKKREMMMIKAANTLPGCTSVDNMNPTQRTTLGGSFVNPDELALQASFDEAILEENSEEEEEESSEEEGEELEGDKEEKTNKITKAKSKKNKTKMRKKTEIEKEMEKAEKELDSTQSNLAQAQLVASPVHKPAPVNTNTNNPNTAAAVAAFNLHTGAAATALITLLNMFSTYYTGPLEPVIRPVLSPEVEKLITNAYTRLANPINTISAMMANIPTHWFNLSLAQVTSPLTQLKPHLGHFATNIINNPNNNNNNIIINVPNSTLSVANLPVMKEMSLLPPYNISNQNTQSIAECKENVALSRVASNPNMYMTNNNKSYHSLTTTTNSVNNEPFIMPSTLSHEPIDIVAEPVDNNKTNEFRKEQHKSCSGDIETNRSYTNNSSSNVISAQNREISNKNGKRISKAELQRPPPLLLRMPATTHTSTVPSSSTIATNTMKAIDIMSNTASNIKVSNTSTPLTSTILPTQQQDQQQNHLSHIPSIQPSSPLVYHSFNNINNNTSSNSLVNMLHGVHNASITNMTVASPTHVPLLPPGASAALLSEIDQAIMVPVHRHGHTIDSTGSSSEDEYVFHDTCPMTSTKITQPSSPLQSYGTYAIPNSSIIDNKKNNNINIIANMISSNSGSFTNNNNNMKNKSKMTVINEEEDHGDNKNNKYENEESKTNSNDMTRSNANAYIDGNSSYSSLLDGAPALTDDPQNTSSHTNNHNINEQTNSQKDSHKHHKTSEADKRVILTKVKESDNKSHADCHFMNKDDANQKEDTKGNTEVVIEECINTDNNNDNKPVANTKQSEVTSVITAASTNNVDVPEIKTASPLCDTTKINSQVPENIGFIRVWEAAENEVRALKAELEEIQFLLSNARATWLSLETEFYRIGSLFLPHTRVDHLNLVPLFIKTLRHFPEDVPIKELQADWLPMLISLVTLSHAEVFFLNTSTNFVKNYYGGKNNNYINGMIPSNHQTPVFEPSFLLSDIAKPPTLHANNIHDPLNRRECESQNMNYYSSFSPGMLSPHTTTLTCNGNVANISSGQAMSIGGGGGVSYQYSSLAHNTIAPFLSRGSYLHYIPKNQVKDAHIAREVYTSGYTAYTIERNTMSTLYSNNSNNFVNHLHTICIATPPPKVSFTSTHCLEQQHELLANGLAMRFTGGSLGVLAGFMYYYGDQILHQFHEGMQQIRMQYHVSDNTSKANSVLQTCRDVLSQSHNVFLRRILIWGAAQGPRKWQERPSIIMKTLTKTFKPHFTNSTHNGLYDIDGSNHVNRTMEDNNSDNNNDNNECNNYLSASFTRRAREREKQMNTIALNLHEHRFLASCKKAVGVKTNMEAGLDDLMRAGVPFHGDEAYALFDAIAYYLSCYEQIEEEWAQWQGVPVGQSLVDHFELYVSSDYYHKQKRAHYYSTMPSFVNNTDNINGVNTFENSDEEDSKVQCTVVNAGNNNTKIKKRSKSKKRKQKEKNRRGKKAVKLYDAHGKPTGNHIRDVKKPLSVYDAETPYCGGEENPELWSTKESQRLFTFLHDALQKWKSRRSDLSSVWFANNTMGSSNTSKTGKRDKNTNDYSKRIAIVML